MKYKDDIYTRYIAVSDVAAKNAIGYYPSKRIGYIFNPFKLDENMVKPHLKIVSAQRFSKTKRPDRIEVVAKALDELEIPYTWNVFMDKYEGTNKNGLIYRKRVMNTLPYIKDADYFAIFMDSTYVPLRRDTIEKATPIAIKNNPQTKANILFIILSLHFL